jgi:DNA-binding beta-propeller fold protein YncE
MSALGAAHRWGCAHLGRILLACAVLGLSLLSSTAASATTVVHVYLPGLQINSGVAPSSPPASSFNPYGVAVDNACWAASLSGPPCNGIGDLANGNVWVGDRNTPSVVDKFAAGPPVAYGCQITGKTPGSSSECNGEVSGSETTVKSFNKLFGIAVDALNGDVLVANRTNKVVDVFGPEGAFLAEFNGGGTIAGGFEPAAIAIDNAGEIYVTDPVHHVVDKFSSPATSAYLCQITGAGAKSTDTQECKPAGPTVSGGKLEGPFGVAVDNSTGDVYVTDNKKHVVDKFNASGEFISAVTGPTEAAGGPAGSGLFSSGLSPRAVAVDQATHHVYVSDTPNGVVDEFSAAGNYVSKMVAPGTFEPVFIAVSQASGDVYVGNENYQQKDVEVFTGDVTLPVATAEQASNIGLHSATLNGEVNPEGESVTRCEFDYDTVEYLSPEESGHGEKVACAQTEAEIGKGLSNVAVDANVPSGLLANTEYHLRLVVETSAQIPTRSAQQSFTTWSPPFVDATWSGDVADTGAQLHADIRPMQGDTRYWFEYDTSEYVPGVPHGKSVPASPGADIGTGLSDNEVTQQITGLTAGTVYHYRVVAESPLGRREGNDQTFTTQPAGLPFALPDGRAWEMVSPPDKHGAMLREISEAGVIEAAADGTAITYWAFGTPTAEAQGAPTEVQLLSRRTAAGWSTQDIATPHDSETTFVAGGGLEYRFFTPDLSSSLVEPGGGFTPLTGEMSPEATERTPFLRHDSTCETEPATCYKPLVTGAEGYADVPHGTIFGGNPAIPAGAVVFRGATPDLSHVVLKPDQLNAPTLALTTPAVNNALYEWSAAAAPTERLQLVSVLPAGEGGTGTESTGLGYNGRDIRHAISNDGSRIFFTVSAVSGGSVVEALYMRDTTKGESVRLDVQEAGISGGVAAAHFQTADAEGMKAFFTDSQRLTANADAAGSDLYECAIVETAGTLTCKLTDLTPEVGGQSVNAQGAVVGASEDGSYVYFVATGALTAAENAEHETAVPGAPNLYLRHYDSDAGKEGWEPPVFITTLAGADANDWAAFGGGMEKLTSRVSPDGRWLAFMSQRSLTGYDNHDAASGEPDEEVFLYHAPAGAGEEGKLVCASCNPTGARPTGIEYGTYPRLVGGNGVWSQDSWLAANLPGFTPFRGGTAAYQSRYLSNSGRLFFNSSDALVPQDVNHQEDVYEWEPSGFGSCSASAPGYSSATGGCVGLISSGTSPDESAFLDASENGDDVFFLTAAKLMPQDVDTALDVYDAHVCSEASPCVTPPVSAPSPCASASTCKSAAQTAGGLEGPPISAAFSGAGNLAPPSKHVVQPTLTRAQKLAKALKACRKQKGRKKRAVCERQARKRYGARSARRAKASGRGRR